MKSEREPMGQRGNTSCSHYLILDSTNSAEKIYITGDVHGSIDAFEAVLNHTEDGTLVIVGDLIDRGLNARGEPGTPEVLNRIIAHNQRADARHKIYAVRGNHEEQFLRVVRAFEHGVAPETHEAFIHGGGGWIFKDMYNPGRNESLVNSYDLSQSMPGRKGYLTPIYDHLGACLTHSDPRSFLVPQISTYQSYIESLPYVIKIDHETHPALVVHADMLLTDDELNRRIRENRPLGESEIIHMLSVKPENFSFTRAGCKTPVYHGHNIIDGDVPRKSARGLVTAVRKETNHINLDGQAYRTGGFIVTNHTDGSAQAVGRSMKPSDQNYLQAACHEIESHLSELRREHILMK